MSAEATRGLRSAAAARLLGRVAVRHAPLSLPGSGMRLRRRALYILPTREGLYYAAVVFVALFAGINYANGLAYALAFLLAAIGVVAILHTHRNLASLRVAAGPAPPVFAGEVARFALVVRNDSDVPRSAIDLSGPTGTQRFDVPAGSETVVTLEVPTAQRGYVAAPPVRLRTRFPLGLWHAWSRPLAIPGACLVYPKPAPEGWPLPERAGTHGTGAPSGRFEDDDFAGLREYRQGDSPQRVAWKKAASGQGWYTKQFAAAGAREILLDWHTLAGYGTEERLSVLCRWVLTAEQQRIPYGLRLPGVRIDPGLGPAHRDRCLERLALFEPP